MTIIKYSAIATVATITFFQSAFAEFKKCSAAFEDSELQEARSSTSPETAQTTPTTQLSLQEVESQKVIRIINKLKAFLPDDRTQFFIEQLKTFPNSEATKLLSYALGPWTRLIFSPEQMAKIFEFLQSSPAYNDEVLSHYSSSYLQQMSKSLTIDQLKTIDAALQYNGIVAIHMTGLAAIFAIELFLTTEDIVNAWERIEKPHRNVQTFGRYALKDFIDRKGHSYSISESQLARLNAVYSRLIKN